MNKMQRFERDPTAERYHARGLELIKSRKDFFKAHQVYDRALGRLASTRHKLDEPSLWMQRGRVIRDDGFVYVHQALLPDAETVSETLETGMAQLNFSNTILGMLKDRGRNAYSQEAWRCVRAEHGATVGLIARTLTAASALELDLLTYDALVFYADAHADLHAGDNRYYETNNAINAARHVRFMGGPAHEVSEWRRLAYKAARQAGRTDPGNAAAAMGSFDSRRQFLGADYENLVSSIFTRP